VETGQVVTEADNGTSIRPKKGENFTLQLRENPTTGYSWQLNLSDGLSILSDEYTQDEAPKEMTGVPGTHSWIIKAVDQGSQQVNGIYKRSWENTTGTEDNFTLAVEVI
jgi:inhibitor of cysteine peptidase